MEENKPTGRPPLFDSEEALNDKVKEYFEYIKGEKTMVGEGDNKLEDWVRLPENATITGLALYLGFESRQSFYDYEKNELFSYTIKRARLKIECEYEKKLSSQACTGSIFALKNMGWKDKSETELSGELGIKQITGMEVK